MGKCAGYNNQVSNSTKCMSRVYSYSTVKSQGRKQGNERGVRRNRIQSKSRLKSPWMILFSLKYYCALLFTRDDSFDGIPFSGVCVDVFYVWLGRSGAVGGANPFPIDRMRLFFCRFHHRLALRQSKSYLAAVYIDVIHSPWFLFTRIENKGAKKRNVIEKCADREEFLSSLLEFDRLLWADAVIARSLLGHAANSST